LYICNVFHQQAQQTMKVVAQTPIFTAADFASPGYTDALNDVRFTTHYFQDSLIKIHQYRDHLELVDLTNAMQAGKRCQRITIAPAGFVERDKVDSKLCTLRAAYGFDYRLLFTNLADFSTPTLQWANMEVTLEGEEWRLNFYDEPAVRTYSPFATLKPLPGLPKKWTAAHVVKALLNGQFENLKCDGKYTDDYLFDLATNYSIGEHVDNGRRMIQRLVERPDGWHFFTYENGALVNMGVGTHEDHSFKFVLKRKKVAA
jgi:hypothetical protein